MTQINSLERLLIVQACTDLINRFAERNDARDADALADMFAEEGVFARPTMPDKPMRGRETIRAAFKARPPGKMTRHVVSNTVVTVLSATEAKAHSYLVLYTRDGERRRCAAARCRRQAASRRLRRQLRPRRRRLEVPRAVGQPGDDDRLISSPQEGEEHMRYTRAAPSASACSFL